METLGRYQILRELGRGAFGVVYSAMDPRIGRKIAIKTIHAGADQNSGEPFRERLRREAHSAGILSHPHIVTIHELDEIDKITYIAMEFVEGHTLAALLAGGQLLPLDFVLTVTRQTADALDFAHSHSIVHRDIKPANIMITTQGNVKVADFGIAKIVDHDASLTKTGMIVGTAHYMSPEQVSGGKVGGRSDQFALGVIAYEMLTGQRPFQGTSWPSILHQIMMVEPAPVRQYRSDLDESVTTVLRRALAKKQAERYTSCREFADELSQSVFNTTVERPGIHLIGHSLKALLPHELLETEIIPVPNHLDNDVDYQIDHDAAPGAKGAVTGLAPYETALRAAHDATLHVSNDEVTKAMNDGTLTVPFAASPHGAPTPPIAITSGREKDRSRVGLVVFAAVAVAIVLTGVWMAFRPASAKPAAAVVVEQAATARPSVVQTQVVQTQKDALTQPVAEPSSTASSAPDPSRPDPAAASDRANGNVSKSPDVGATPGNRSRPVMESQKPPNSNREPVTVAVLKSNPDNSAAELPESAPPLGKYRGPPEGHFAWTGSLGPSGRLTITGNRPSSGSVDGRGLPLGLAVTVQADPSTIQVVEQPSAANQFRLVLRNTGGSQTAAINIDWKENRE